MYEQIDASKTLCALVSPTLKQGKLNHLDLMEDELSGPWKHLGGKLDRQTTTWRFRNGSTIQFYGCVPKPSRGPRFDLICADECDDIDKSLFHGVIEPWLSATWSKQIMILGGTPTRGRFGLLYEQAVKFGQDPAYPMHQTVFSTALDSPEITSPEAVAKAFSTTPRPLFNREWLCDFDSGNGMVYPMFSHEHHVREKPENVHAHRHITGGDYGYRDPTVFIPIAQCGAGNDAIFYARNEYYRPGMLPSFNREQAIHFSQMYPGPWHYDPSRPEIIAEYRNLGIDIQGAKNSIIEGVALVADYLNIIEDEDGSRHSRLYIDPKCVETIREFETYRRREDPRNPGKFMEEIVDKNNHAMDAIRYAMYSEFGTAETASYTR